MRDYKQPRPTWPTYEAPGALALSKHVHAVIFVVKANDPRLKDGKYKDTLQKIREHFRQDGNSDMCDMLDLISWSFRAAFLWRGYALTIIYSILGLVF